MSTDTLLTLAAAAVELGVPAFCLVAWTRRPHWRPQLAVILGAAVPWLLLYLAIFASWALLPTRERLWPLLAIWIMSFVLYAGNLGIAAVLAGMPSPTRLRWRAALGASPALAVGSVAALAHLR